MIQNRISRKFKRRNLGCPYESVSFDKILLHTWDRHIWFTISLPDVNFRIAQKDCANLQSFRRHVKSKHCWFFEQHLKYFSTQQAAADEADLLVNNADIQEVDDLQQVDFSEVPRGDLQEGTNGLDTDESNVNHFDLIANVLLEFREKYNVSTSPTCFISKKLGYIVEQDRNMFANNMLNVLHKDGNFVQSYELRMTVHMVSPFVKACHTFTGQTSLSTYIKASKCL